VAKEREKIRTKRVKTKRSQIIEAPKKMVFEFFVKGKNKKDDKRKVGEGKSK